MEGKVQFHLRDIPANLMAAIELRARTEGTSAQNIVAELLCARYKVPYTRTRLRPDRARTEITEYIHSNGRNLGITMNLRIPSAVADALKRHSARNGFSQRQIALAILARALDVKIPKPRNARHGRPRGRKVKA